MDMHKSYPRILADPVDLTVVTLDTITGADPIIENPVTDADSLILNEPEGLVFLRIHNPDGVSHSGSILVTHQFIENGEVIPDPPGILATIPAGETRVFGPWSINFSNENSKVLIDWSASSENLELETYRIGG